MKSTYYRIFMAGALALASGAACVPAWAAGTYPSHPVRLIVTSAPGSGLDLVARAIAPDLPYDTVKDITAVTLIGSVPLVLAVPAKSPYKTAQDLIQAARAHPDKINFGSAGLGSALDVAGLMLEKMAHIKFMHIPYRGGNPLMTDLMSGQVATAFLAVSTAEAQIKAGTIRALAVSSARRLPSLPAVPTLAESGVAGYHYAAWIGLIGPAKLPAQVAALLQSTVHEVIALPGVKKQFAVQGFDPSGTSSAEFLETLKKEIASTRALMGKPPAAKAGG